MILVHRLRGEPMYLNPDLIESVEAIPDTVLTLVDGRKALVLEAPVDVVDSIRTFRASVLVRAEELLGSGVRHLRLLVDREPSVDETEE